ncbi:hypothetical protein GCM10022292_18060 [Winogradskyella damuponensis]|uniref:Uncharacterized protein n=1 Tax=Winogradskyella damuponensis TaxID=943939 RepID=A0ABP8CU66_9FLAO
MNFMSSSDTFLVASNSLVACLKLKAFKMSSFAMFGVFIIIYYYLIYYFIIDTIKSIVTKVYIVLVSHNNGQKG